MVPLDSDAGMQPARWLQLLEPRVNESAAIAIDQVCLVKQGGVASVPPFAFCQGFLAKGNLTARRLERVDRLPLDASFPRKGSLCKNGLGPTLGNMSQVHCNISEGLCARHG